MVLAWGMMLRGAWYCSRVWCYAVCGTEAGYGGQEGGPKGGRRRVGVARSGVPSLGGTPIPYTIIISYLPML